MRQQDQTPVTTVAQLGLRRFAPAIFHHSLGEADPRWVSPMTSTLVADDTGAVRR
ncbi:hypothetical protein BZL29_7708 [Mycobacterium kansasii]|uniref:Uncharacterized protein n=1 Tax=Mycobacterium kansasii TaxID=1768 RepID=A0A1V3WER8_MYCKA|nr:hypothetical protein BZL29_7708 [Mycobacterium kansasii]